MEALDINRDGKIDYVRKKEDFFVLFLMQFYFHLC